MSGKRGGGRGGGGRHSSHCWIIEVQGCSALSEHGQELKSGPSVCASSLPFLAIGSFLPQPLFPSFFVSFTLSSSQFLVISSPLLFLERPCKAVCVRSFFQAFGGLVVHSLEADWRRADKRSSAAWWMFNGTNCEYLMTGRVRKNHIWKGKDADMERESEPVRDVSYNSAW